MITVLAHGTRQLESVHTYAALKGNKEEKQVYPNMFAHSMALASIKVQLNSSSTQMTMAITKVAESSHLPFCHHPCKVRLNFYANSVMLDKYQLRVLSCFVELG